MGTLKDHYGDNQSVKANRYQSKARSRLSDRSLQDCATAIEQLNHQALSGSLEDFIQREAACVLIKGLGSEAALPHEQ
jgi:hypothetical protein